MAKKKVLNNPWLIATGSAILGVIGIRILDMIIGTTIIHLIWLFIKNIFVTIGKFFIIKFEVTLWFFITMLIITVALIIFILWIVSFLKNKMNILSDQQTPFLSYREEVFEGVLYRWDYIKDYSDKYYIINISHFCPKCKCSLVNDSCPICHGYYYDKIKTDYEIDALIRHKIETQFNIK